MDSKTEPASGRPEDKRPAPKALRKMPEETAKNVFKVTCTGYSAGDGCKGKAFRHPQKSPVHKKHK